MPSLFRCVRRACQAAAIVAAVLTLSRPHTARADDAVALVVDLVTRDDADFRAIGLDRIRHGAKGDAATRSFAALVEKQPPARQVELLRALADRGDAAALAAITALLGRSQDAAVRMAAIDAIGTLGSGGEVPLLVKSLTAGDPERAAARGALVAIRGDDAIRQIVAAAKSGDAGLRPLLIDVIGARRARSALPDLASFTADADRAVRQAALRGLGELGGAAEVPVMIAGLLAAAPEGDRQEAERAVVAVCTKNPGHQAAAAAFLDAFKAAPAADQEVLLPALGGIGGNAALAVVDQMIADSDAAKRQFGIKALTRWPDATVAPRLLDLVGRAQDPAERDLLVGTLIRIAPLPDNKLNDRQKLDLVKKTMALCSTDAERARLIERTSAIRTVEAFRFVVPFLDQPAFAAPAAKSVVDLAHHQKLRDAHKAEFVVALDKVIGVSKDAVLVERASRYKEGKTWERK